MSKQELVSEKLRELRFRLFSQQSGICFSCGLPMAITDMEAAHRIPDRKWTVKLFGEAVIDHPKNFRGTHRGRCNSKAQLNPDSIWAEDLAREIQRETGGNKTMEGEREEVHAMSDLRERVARELFAIEGLHIDYDKDLEEEDRESLRQDADRIIALLAPRGCSTDRHSTDCPVRSGGICNCWMHSPAPRDEEPGLRELLVQALEWLKDSHKGCNASCRSKTLIKRIEFALAASPVEGEKK